MKSDIKDVVDGPLADFMASVEDLDPSGPDRAVLCDFVRRSGIDMDDLVRAGEVFNLPSGIDAELAAGIVASIIVSLRNAGWTIQPPVPRH